MALATVATCNECGKECARHCKVKACPWVVCPDHGAKRLSRSQRRRMDGDNAA